MPATEPLYNVIGFYPRDLSKEENYLLEAEFFIRIWEELKEIFRKQYKEYFRLMKLNNEMEDAVLEDDFVRLIIKDLILMGEYTIEGIACYTNTHEDIVRELAAGRNTNPSAKFLRRLIELHRAERRDLYLSIMKKITTGNSEAA